MKNNFIHTKNNSFNVYHIVNIDWEFIVENPQSQDVVVCIDTVTSEEDIYLYYKHKDDYSAIQRLKEITGYQSYESKKVID